MIGIAIAGVLAMGFLGVLEYNSMYFGFAFLYWLALALYVLTFTSWRWRTHNRAMSSAPVKAA